MQAKTKVTGEDDTHGMSHWDSTGFTLTAKGKQSLTVSHSLS